MVSVSSILNDLGLHRRELRAWAMYDWANSAFMTIIITAVFPPFFRDYAAKGHANADTLFSGVTWVAILLSAVISLLLGAVADALGAQKRLLFMLTVIGSLATAAMFFIPPGNWVIAAVLFAVANIAIMCAFVCYNAMLPFIATAEESDRVSSGGFAMGYLGGGLALAISLVLISFMADTWLACRLAFVLTGGWWILFAIPLFLQVREAPAGTRLSPGQAIAGMVGMLVQTIKSLRHEPQILLFLVAFMLYSDGINTIIRMASIYGAELNIKQDVMIKAILLTQFVGFPFAFLFGYLSRFFGAKPLILFGIGVYVLIALVGYKMSTSAHFIGLALLVGTVQGGTQALSRSLFTRMIPRERATEYFSIYGILDRFSGVIGSSLLLICGHFTGSSRNGVLGVAVMFLIGGMLLFAVKPKPVTAES